MKDRIPTQNEEVLAYLKKHKTITAMEGFTKLYIVDLAGCIRDLRKVYVIDDVWVEKTNFWGKKVRYKKYNLVRKKGE